jgi:hypothetical protein
MMTAKMLQCNENSKMNFNRLKTHFPNQEWMAVCLPVRTGETMDRRLPAKRKCPARTPGI